jgi:hypothetical protein
MEPIWPAIGFLFDITLWGFRSSSARAPTGSLLVSRGGYEQTSSGRRSTIAA